MSIDFVSLERAFNPNCVAIIGDNEKSNFFWLRAESTFKGRLYSVQTNPKTIKLIEELGVRNYTSLLDIPEAVDLVIVSVPMAVSLQILEDCIQKQVAAVHFFTAGFTETGAKEGRRVEQRLIKRAKELGVPLIGPNCMGIFNPKIGLRQSSEQYTGISGLVGFISQSGTYADTFALEGHEQGININKSVSFGNGSVVDSTDFLEYFGKDTEIKAIGMYLEGVKNGRRFQTVLKEVVRQKPVVIWKGGVTREGGRAIASHTASMIVPSAIWQAATKQAGAINVESLEGLIDTLKILLNVSPVHGDRVGIIGGSGGESVVLTDKFVGSGLRVPLLSQNSYEEFDKFFSIVGGSYRNPIDNGNVSRMFLKRTVEILERDSNIDNLAIQLTLLPEDLSIHGLLDNDIRSLLELRQRTLKPVIVIIAAIGMTARQKELAKEVTRKLQDGNIPVFSSIERGSRALKNALFYYRFKKSSALPAYSR